VSVGAEVELDQGFECALFGCALFGGGDPIWLGDHNGAAVQPSASTSSGN